MGDGVGADLLHGVAQGVAQVQKSPAAPVKFVRRHGVPLQGNAPGDDRLPLLPYRGLLQGGKEPFIEKDAILDDLGAAAAVLPLRQGREQRRVTEDQGRLVEAARLILPRGEVDAGLSTHGGVHRGQKARGHLAECHAPLIGGGGKAREIPGDAASQGYQDVASGQAAAPQEVQERGIGREVFGRLPRREGEGNGAEARFLQRGCQPGAVEGKDGLIRRHGGGGGVRQDPPELRPGPVQQVRPDENVIVPGGGHGNALHLPSTSSFRFRPSSRRRTRVSQSFSAMASRYSVRLAM